MTADEALRSATRALLQRQADAAMALAFEQTERWLWGFVREKLRQRTGTAPPAHPRPSPAALAAMDLAERQRAPAASRRDVDAPS